MHFLSVDIMEFLEIFRFFFFFKISVEIKGEQKKQIHPL